MKSHLFVNNKFIILLFKPFYYFKNNFNAFNLAHLVL